MSQAVDHNFQELRAIPQVWWRRGASRTAVFAGVAVVYVLAICFLWQGVVVVFGVPDYIVPPPAAVAQSLLELPMFYLYHAAVTAGEAFAAILIGFSAGFLIGVVLKYGGWFGRALSPLVVASQVFPKEALAPLFLIYFGFGMLPKIVISSLICFFPVAINTFHGLNATPEGHHRLMHMMGANAWQKFYHCELPFSLSHITAAARVCAVLGLIGAVVGEFVGASAGLGHVIRAANADISTERIFAALILLGVIGGLFYGIAVLLDRCLLSRFPVNS